MPGFRVNDLGSGPVATVQPFYSYTWEILNLFGTNARDSALVYARECTLPTFTANKEIVEGASLIYKYASHIEWEDCRIVFYDVPVSGKTLEDELTEWRERIWTPEEGLKEAANSNGYKKESRISNFNMDESIRQTWVLKGSWPQQIRSGELSYATSDIKLVEVNVVYDWAVRE